MQQPAALARVTAVLRALGVGDALGRATEGYTPDEIIEVYEDIVTDFVEPVRLFDDEPWDEGEVGPPTRIVVEASEHAGVWTPRLATIEVAHLPAGIALGLAAPLPNLLGRVTGDAALTAIAAGLSAALDGHPPIEVVAAGSRGARLAGDAELAEAILEAGGIAQASGGRRTGQALRGRYPPDGDVDSVVPFIFGIVYATQSARRAMVEAVNQGGHAPEIAGIAGAICAAIAPVTLPGPWGAEIERINSLDLEAIARTYLALRGA